MKSGLARLASMCGALALAGAGGLVGGCDDGDGESAKEARANIMPTAGNTAMGLALFQADGDKVKLTVTVSGLAPGMHGVHIHQIGDCSAGMDGSGAGSAGGHWNPAPEMAHGTWGVGAHHLGDIGNLSVGSDGTGTISLTTDKWSIGTGLTNDVVGKSVIVHKDPDDLMTQPAGAAGPRIGCAIITLT